MQRWVQLKIKYRYSILFSNKELFESLNLIGQIPFQTREQILAATLHLKGSLSLGTTFRS
jgi:hypothetical protein